MPRSSSRRSAPAPSRSAPPPAPRASPPPPAAVPAPAQPSMMAPQQQGGGMLSGLAGTVAQGFAFGTGSALARQAVGSIFGGSDSSAPAAPAPAPAAPVPSYGNACEFDKSQLMDCLKSAGQQSECDYFYNALKACQQSNM